MKHERNDNEFLFNMTRSEETNNGFVSFIDLFFFF